MKDGGDTLLCASETRRSQGTDIRTTIDTTYNVKLIGSWGLFDIHFLGFVNVSS